MHEIALLLLDGGAATEIATTVDLLDPILTRHEVSIGEIRRITMQDPHPARLDEMFREGLPVLVRVAGGAEHLAVKRAIEIVGRSWDNQSEWLMVLPPNERGSQDILAEDVKRALGARVMTPEWPSLPGRVVSELGARNLTLAGAESCTGGMLGAQITSVAGSSEVFWGSLVTYSYEAKSAVLGVDSGTLERHGAVSEEVVREMAAGARRLAASDIAVAISGVAGPGGGTADKPVGTVWLACETAWSGVTTRLLRLHGGRESVRQGAVWDCLDLVLSSLKGTG